VDDVEQRISNINPDDIFLHFDERSKTLSASCDHPIAIENDYPRYRIRRQLTDFRSNGRTADWKYVAVEDEWN
jgi:hypothetical protein